MHKTEFGHPADEIFRETLFVRNEKGVLGSLVLFQFFTKGLQRGSVRGKVDVRLVCGVSEEETGLNEEWVAPLDHRIGLRRDTLENRVELA